MMTKRIIVTPEIRKKIAKVFGCSERTVWNALGFDSKRGDSDKAARIRKMAMENGGEVMVTLPEKELMR